MAEGRKAKGSMKIRKKVLVTNDDGITAKGLTVLVDKLSNKFEVYAVAPAEQQSAKSMAVTFLREAGVEKCELEGAREAYIVDGTPVDCVLWAVPWFRERGIEFDYLISGINLGANVGIAAYYSGTIGAAREGALQGVRSIALSVGTTEARHFGYIINMIPRVMEMADSLSASTFLSVNAPDLEPWEVRGMRVAEVAPHGYEEKYSFSPAGDNKGLSHDEIEWNGPVNFQLAQYSLDGGPTSGSSPKIGLSMQSDWRLAVPEADLRYDLDCVARGYAAVTPLSTVCSDDVALRKLQGRYSSYDYLAVFIDVQEHTASGIEMRNRFTGNISRFASCVRRLDLPVFVTELAGSGSLIDELSELPARSRAETAMRREFSAWGSGDFARKMAATSARKVFIAGLETHAAVLQTAIDFVRRGYEVTVIEDCCASREGHDHKMAVERLRCEGCTVTTSRAALMELVSTVSHPAAEAIARIMM